MAPLFALYDPNSYQGSAVEELKKVVKGIQNATLGVIPRSTPASLELWSQSLNKGSSDIFLAALDRFDQHIARAVLVPDLIGMSSNTGQVGSLARSGTHADSFLRVVSQIQNEIADSVMNAQVIPQLCDLNFPNLKSYPVFRFLPFSDDRRLEIMNTWAAMVGGQIVNKIKDDEIHIRKIMGFPDNADPEVLPNPEPQGKPSPFGQALDEAKEDAVTAEENKPAPDEPEVAPTDKQVKKVVEQAEQSEEMRTFAEEHDAVWVELVDGQRVAIPQEDYVEA